MHGSQLRCSGPSRARTERRLRLLVAMLGVVGALMGVLLTSSQAAAQRVPAMVSIEPTPAEVHAFELLQDFRADPASESRPIAAALKRGELPWHRMVDAQMFEEELSQRGPVPPLVMSPILLIAARQHSHYMLRHGQSHQQQPDHTWYLARTPAGRIQHFGHPIAIARENVVIDVTDQRLAHLAFLINPGHDGPGGMQPKRGHREGMLATDVREAAVGVVGGQGDMAVTQLYAQPRRVPRLAGGVVYVDHNRNGRYDPGEGAHGVIVRTTDGQVSTTGHAGAFWFHLRSQNPVRITASYESASHDQLFPSGGESLRLNWRMTPQEAQQVLAALLRELEPLSAGGRDLPPHRALQLRAVAKAARPDADTAQRVARLTKPVIDHVDATKQTLREALAAGDARSFNFTFTREATRYRLTHEGSWFEHAQAAMLLRNRIGAAHVRPEDRQALATQVELLIVSTHHDDLVKMLETMLEDVRGDGV